MLMATQSTKIVLPVTIILAVLDICAVSLRFYVRRRKKQRLQVDDWLTIPALRLYSSTYCKESSSRSAPILLLSAQLIPSQDEWIFFLVSIPALGFIKLSILCFYQRIFTVSKRDFKNAMCVSTWFMIAAVSAWMLGFFLRYLFACRTDFDIWWTNAMRIMTECGDFQMILNALAISDFVCDLVILVMPIFPIWRLQLAIRSKIAVTIVFALGGFAVVASLIRMIWCIWQSNQNFNPDFDATLLITTFLFWNYLEATVGLLAACIPTLRSLITTSSLDSIVETVRIKFSKNSILSLTSLTRQSSRSQETGSETGFAYDTSKYKVTIPPQSTRELL
ncbi:hypothetical protein B0J11DRAFT_550072 [Dendryphion nanum]|uniref:Rhodopsin domain-containing protein n=1 Tax=Dendryphion nanum TaxID=256645 RepID=A0A9P9IN59_9PLEO|nr:hypothetical protein B0J11DRAFT_550072 [Dendryphion nanum]